MTESILVKELGKQYRRYPKDRAWTFQEVFQWGLRRIRPIHTFWALREVSFTVSPGHMLGIVGRNGAGKSTLLRLLSGVSWPDEGTVEVSGRLDALLDLGTGFHSDLTGRENVYVNGVINGLTRREITQRFDSIVAFAEVEDFIDSPLRTYSTGMQMRLAFAVATHTHPDILLIDEVLAVGDLAFQRKCLDRIARFKAEGCTIVLVSHDTDLVAELCDEALWLRGGLVAAYGTGADVVRRYVNETASSEQQPPDWHALTELRT
jgi:lipopolysaccharide transport system ATP-binding protein